MRNNDAELLVAGLLHARLGQGALVRAGKFTCLDDAAFRQVERALDAIWKDGQELSILFSSDGEGHLLADGEPVGQRVGQAPELVIRDVLKDDPDFWRSCLRHLNRLDWGLLDWALKMFRKAQRTAAAA
ncbi:MAG: hypothetical protein WC551_05970 [Patescibacteria group bacterium]